MIKNKLVARFFRGKTHKKEKTHKENHGHLRGKFHKENQGLSL